MPFELYISNKLHRQKQFSSFRPFCSEQNDLPSCTTTVYEMDQDIDVFNKRGVLYKDYSELKDSIWTPDGKYSIMPYNNGVIIQTRKNSLRTTIDGFAYVHSNMGRVDLLLDSLHAAINVSYDLTLCSYQYICANAGALLMHAAAIVYKGEAILFCGVSGAGKSTQAGHWVKYYDAEPINFDHPCIIWDGDTPIAYGTPWGGKENYCQPVGAPVKAIVFVHKNDHSTVRKMSKGEAYSKLALNNAFPHINKELDKKYYSVIEKLVLRVPVYHQEGTLTREAPDTLHKVLYGEI